MLSSINSRYHFLVPMVIMLAMILHSYVAFGQDDCAEIDALAQEWDLIATELDSQSRRNGQLSPKEADRLGEAAAQAMELTWLFSDALSDVGGPSVAKLSRRLDDDLAFLDEVESIDNIVEAIDALTLTLDDILDVCTDESPRRLAESGALPLTFEMPADYRELARALKNAGTFQELTEWVSDEFILPTDIAINFAACGTPNAFYDGQNLQITMCYELLMEAATLIATPATTEEETGALVLGVGTFFLLHEIGHALVHVLELPITGREEDAVDNLATLILLTGGDEDEAAIFATLDNFAALAQHTEQGQIELPFWDEHSLNSQRLYDIACLVYGSDPQRYKHMVGEEGLPEERAQGCVAQWQQKDQAWGVLLEPYLVD